MVEGTWIFSESRLSMCRAWLQLVSAYQKSSGFGAIFDELAVPSCFRIALVPKLGDFQRALRGLLDQALKSGRHELAISAADLDDEVVGHPGANHRMPMCCDAMVTEMWSDDELLSAPPDGIGHSLTISYRLPRRWQQ